MFIPLLLFLLVFALFALALFLFVLLAIFALELFTFEGVLVNYASDVLLPALPLLEGKDLP